MSAQAIQKKRDMDTLHVLPLSIIPLKTAGLKRARLVKNAQMEGMIELFSSDRGGSGQIAPKHLDRVFQFDETNFRDQVIVTKLADLPSYDVYSLRISLRELGIDVDEEKSLRISHDKYMELGELHAGLHPAAAGQHLWPQRPVCRSVQRDPAVGVGAGEGESETQSRPAGRAARHRGSSRSPASSRTTATPNLSLAYYQQCLDNILPSLSVFLRSARQLQKDDTVKRDMILSAACTLVEARLSNAARVNGGVKPGHVAEQKWATLVR